jgi:signal transduction histidine kinase
LDKFYLVYRAGRLAFSAGLLVLILSISSVTNLIFSDKFTLTVLEIYTVVSFALFILSRKPHLFEFLLDELFLFLLVFKGAFSYTFFSIFLLFPVFFSELFLGSYYGYASTFVGIALHFLYFSLVFEHFSFPSVLQFLFNSSALILMTLASQRLKLKLELQESYIRSLEKEKKDAELYRKLYEISANLAHELKNPLASIKGAVELLMEGKNNQRLLKIIHRESQKLDSVIKDFLNLARPYSENRIVISLKDAVREVISSFESYNREVELNLKELLVKADQRALYSALDNLIRNALQWSKERIRVSTFKEGNWAVLTVEDDGPGIPDEEKEKVFEPFFSRRREGSGLGLAVVKKFAIDSGGFISVENSPLGGAKFTLKLPIFKEENESSDS